MMLEQKEFNDVVLKVNLVNTSTQGISVLINSNDGYLLIFLPNTVFSNINLYVLI